MLCERHMDQRRDSNRATGSENQPSDKVGWAKHVRAMSSDDAWYSTARHAEAIISPALGPMMWHPKTWSVSFSTIYRAERSRQSELSERWLHACSRTHEFHQTLGILVGLCTRVGRERELADLVRDTGLLQLLLILSDPRDFRVRVHNGRNRIIVDVSVTRLDDFDGGDTFFFSLVGQHGTECSVTDTLDSLDAGVELVVDNDTTSVVELDTDLFQSEVLGDRSSTDGYQDDVGFEL
jgi:hypothetical protein